MGIIGLKEVLFCIIFHFLNEIQVRTQEFIQMICMTVKVRY